jgi:hypothetical protein
MTDLLTALQSAEQGSRELDAAVWYACFEPDVEHFGIHVEQTEQGPREVLTCELGSKWADDVGHYTTSTDAALALVERVVGAGDFTYRLTSDYGGYYAAELRIDSNPAKPVVVKETGDTMPLALVIALVRAKEGAA